MKYNIDIRFTHLSSSSQITGYLFKEPVEESLEEIEGVRDELQQLYSKEQMTSLSLFAQRADLEVDDPDVTGCKIAEISINRSIITGSVMVLQIVEFDHNEPASE